MNVKFKMPKFGRTLSGRSMLKELLLTVLATTISIILTFGTAAWLDKRKQQAYGRQLAYMTIHDIDNTAEMLERYVTDENDGYLLAQYLLDHKDSLNTIGLDTLQTVMFYVLSYNDKFTLDDASEKIFLSSQEAWSNIDNITFIDRVQSFYNHRHEIFDYLNTSLQWRKPVGEKEFMQVQIDSPRFMMDVVDFMDELLQRNDVCYYIACSPLRQHRINAIINEWKKVSDECKFMMGISDSELDEYIASRSKTGERVRDRQLVGRWFGKGEPTMNSERENHLEFRKDHSATLTFTTYYSSSIYSGRISNKLIIQATWELKGDSLYISQLPDLECVLDTTGISYRAEMKSFVEDDTRQIMKSNQAQQDFYLQQGVTVIAYQASIDPSKSKLEMIVKEQDEDGTEETIVRYLTKEEDK